MEKVYNLFKGHTYYIQKTFNEAFAETAEGGECTMETIRAAIDEMIASNDTIFREILSNIPEKQKALLYAIAGEGEAERITSSDFIKRHGLTSASSVQSAAKKLLEKDIITGPRGRRRLRGILLLRCGLFKPVYLYSADAGVGGGSGELERRQFLREFFHTFLYAFHSPSAGLVPSVQVVPELGLIHSGDALESGK